MISSLQDGTYVDVNDAYLDMFARRERGHRQERAHARRVAGAAGTPAIREKSSFRTDKRARIQALLKKKDGDVIGGAALG